MLDKNKEKQHAKKFRGGWGNIKPITKIIPNKKKMKKEKYNKHLYEDAYLYFIFIY